MGDPCIKVFPWTNRGEFQRIFKELYSSNKTVQTHALGRIEVWRTRVAKLPVAVDTTSQLVRCSLLSDLTDADRAQALGFMIMKFVNNITEEKQQKFYKQPITQIAAEMGIERWIVNLRHQIAHGNMPSIHLLQAAVNWSLTWLKTHYWEVQLKEYDPPYVPVEERLAVLKTILDEYRKKKIREIENENVMVDSKLLSKIEQSMFGLGDKSFQVLVSPGYLILTNAQLSEIKTSYEEIVEETSGLPEKLYDFWTPVLTVVENLGLMPSLLLYIVSIITPETSLKNRLLYGWMYMILLKNKNTSFIPYRQLLEIAIQITNLFALPTLLLLIESVDEQFLAKDKKKELLTEVERYYGILTSEEIRDISASSSEDVQLANRTWRKCVKQIHWSSHPIGLLPNQNISYKNLELDWPGFDKEELEEQKDTNQGDNLETSNTSLIEDMDELQPQTMDVESQESTNSLQLWSDDKVKAIVEEIVLF